MTTSPQCSIPVSKTIEQSTVQVIIYDVSLFTTASQARQRSTVPLQGARLRAPPWPATPFLTKLFRAVTLTHITPGL